ncbi:MAG: LPXTG cell wall anchor domain-containing protein [Ruminiclostridium sp.]
MKLRKVLAAIAASAVAVSSIAFSASAAIADTETVIDDSWSKSVEFGTGVVTEACTIEVKIKDAKDDAQICLKTKDAGWPAVDLTDNFTTDGSSASFDSQWGVLAISADTTSIKLDIDADEAAKLNEFGGVFAGKNYTFVSADFAAAAENTAADDTAAESQSLGGTVNAALYVGESVTWVTASSDKQAISTTGEYTFKLDGLAIAPSALTVIYVKDADVEGGSASATNINADTQIITKSVKINGTEVALTEGYNTELAKGVLDVCWYNIWATHYISIDGIDEINSVEVTVEFAAGAPAEEAPAEDKEEDKAEEEDEAPADEDDADVAPLELADCYNNGTVILVADDGSNAYCTSNGIDVTTVYGYKVTAQFPAAEVADEATWIGGGIGTNSNSTGWASTEWGRAEKPILVTFDSNGVAEIEFLSDAPLFAADDAYAQLWIQCWGGTMTILDIDVLGEDGEVIDCLTVAEPQDQEVVAADDEDEAPAEGDVDAATDDDKGSPDTGVADVAVVAGLAIVAAGAVLVSKKRK